MLISLTIPGAPVAKGRPRFTTRGGFARSYTPAKTQAYEDLIRCEAIDAMGGRRPINEPVAMAITAYVPMPKAMPRKRRLDAMDGALKPVTRPDVDNYAKAALDGCNAIVYRDDSLVTSLTVHKRYSAQPRLVITVEIESEAI